jgi:A1 cistron-splicing factor AAR2
MSLGRLLFLNSPEKLEFGINYHQWAIGPNFKGMKNIPIGPSLITYSLGLTKSTIFKHFSNNFYAFKYSAELEEFIEELDIEQLKRFELSFNEFDPYLGCYPQNKDSERWLKNYLYLKQDVVEIIMHKGFVSTNSVSRFSNEWEREQQRDIDKIAKMEKEREAKSSPLCEELMVADVTNSEPETTVVENDASSDLIPQENQVTHPTDLDFILKQEFINFSDFNLKKSYPSNATPLQITKYSLDKSNLLLRVLNKYPTPTDLLTELHLSFLLFQLGQLYDGYEQWKQLILLICSSFEALNQRQFYFEFIEIFNKEILDFPEDFFVNGGGFLVLALNEFCTNLLEFADLELIERATGLVEQVDRKFGWNLSVSLYRTLDVLDLDEGDEDRPVIV